MTSSTPPHHHLSPSLKPLLSKCHHSVTLYLKNPSTRLQTIYLFLQLGYIIMLAIWVLWNGVYHLHLMGVAATTGKDMNAADALATDDAITAAAAAPIPNPDSPISHSPHHHLHYGFLFGWLTVSHAICRFLYNVLGVLSVTKAINWIDRGRNASSNKRRNWQQKCDAERNHQGAAAQSHSAGTPTVTSPDHLVIETPTSASSQPDTPSYASFHSEFHHLSRKFSYGLQRLEVLLRFSIAILVCFLCVALCTESIHSVMERDSIPLRGTFKMGLLGLGVNMLGLWIFKRFAREMASARYWWWSNQSASSFSHPSSSVQSPLSASSFEWSSFLSYSSNSGSGSASPRFSSWGNGNNISARESFLFSNSHWMWNRHSRQFLARALSGSLPQVLLMLISILIGGKNYSSSWDFCLTMVCSGVLILFQVPELHQSALILLQTTPSHMQNALSKCLRELSTIDGVLECYSEHFWSLGFDIHSTMGTVNVRVQEDANESSIAHQCREIFALLIPEDSTEGMKLFVQIEKDSFASQQHSFHHHHHEDAFGEVALSPHSDRNLTPSSVSTPC